MDDRQNYYEILNIAPTATPEDIKMAFRRLARQYHPDFNPNNPQAEEQFKRILDAYEVLWNPERRRQYDLQLGIEAEEKKPHQANEWDFYVQGIEKAIQKDYQGAIDNYNRAINLNPNFLEAYLKRGEVFYTLKDDRMVLGNCRQILQFFPDCAEAHYYQGRSRYRLGYVQSAIESYDRAIGCNPNFAAAYYYRGVANHDLHEHFPAEGDLERAAELFQEQSDRSGYQLAKDTLSRLGKKDWREDFNGGINLTKRMVWAGFGIVINPSNGGTNAFLTLQIGEAVVMGTCCAAMANILFILGVYLGWQDRIVFPFWYLSILGFLPWLSLAVLGFSLRFLFRIRAHFGADLFLAGISVIPIGFLALASGISSHLGGTAMAILTLFTSTHLMITLYNGTIKISGFSEAIAAWCVPIMLLISGWLTFTGFQVLMSY
ncbi:MAG: DnaJ domain-containing protein [Cyanobacteria bacterium SBLK]|nr:DnaJ domain-containing protein [Cyanobacteria bacterium SBLK]